MIKKFLAVTIVTMLSIFFLAAPVSAQFDPLTPACQTQAADSVACKSNNVQENPILGPNGVITKVVQILIMVTAVASVIMIMIGGFRYIVSTGDPSNVNSAKNSILYAIVGLVVAVVAQTIVIFVLRKL